MITQSLAPNSTLQLMLRWLLAHLVRAWWVVDLAAVQLR
jgi:hypothetical protein